MKQLTIFINTFEKAIEFIAIILFSLGILITTLGTLSRTLTFLPNIPWSSEFTQFTIVASTFLVFGIGVKNGTQIALDLVIEKLSPFSKVAIQMVNNCLMIWFFLVIGFYGFKLAITNLNQISALLEIPMFYPYIFIPIGSLILILEVIFLAIEQILVFRKAKEG